MNGVIDNMKDFKKHSDKELHALLEKSIQLNRNVIQTTIEQEMPDCPEDKKKEELEKRHAAWRAEFIETFKRHELEITC